MLGFRHQLTNHGLDDSNVSVEETADNPSQQGHPDVGGESNHDHAEHCPDTPKQEDGLPPDSVRETSPVHAHQGLGEREGGNEESGVERGIVLVADLESLDKSPGIGKDGGEGDGLCETDDGCMGVQLVSTGNFSKSSGRNSPRRNSWMVGKSSGLRCPTRAILALVRDFAPVDKLDQTSHRCRGFGEKSSVPNSSCALESHDGTKQRREEEDQVWWREVIWSSSVLGRIAQQLSLRQLLPTRE